ncbi:MAG: hypothetical protein U0793_16080 [Gemmataceae bacterium]
MGTPAFMPPEQAVGATGELDERCDVFALGAVRVFSSRAGLLIPARPSPRCCGRRTPAAWATRLPGSTRAARTSTWSPWRGVAWLAKGPSRPCGVVAEALASINARCGRGYATRKSSAQAQTKAEEIKRRASKKQEEHGRSNRHQVTLAQRGGC